MNHDWIVQEILCTLKQVHPKHIDQVSLQDAKRNFLGTIVPSIQTYQSYASDDVQLNHLRNSDTLGRDIEYNRVVWMIFTSEEIRVEKSIMIWRSLK